MPQDRMFQDTSIVQLFITALLCTPSAGYNMDIYSSDFFNNTLEKYCPNASIFSQSVSANIFTGYQYPCCKSCSRHRECGRHRNCCFYGDDLYRYAGSETCISSGFGVATRGRELYYMVNKCLDPNQKCEQAKAASWGSIYPVYSPNSKRIYFNEQCAICNGEREVTSFQPMFGCSIRSRIPQESYTDELAKLLVGKHATECEIMFKPPEGIDLTNYECISPIIRTCLEGYNNTGLVSEGEMKALCESFNATILLRKPPFVVTYGNAFCALCNGESVEACTYSARPHELNSKLYGLGFHIILSGLKQLNVEVQAYGVSTDKQICRKNDTFYNGTICKPLLCPEGRLWDGETCRVFINYRSVRKYFITVRLTHANPDETLPVSMLENLGQEKRGPRARWLKRAGLQDWDAFVFYRARNASIDNVDYLIVMLRLENRNAKNMDFSHILNTIGVSMATIWEVHIFDEKLHFHATFDKFYKYELVNETTLLYTGYSAVHISIMNMEIDFVKQLSKYNSCFFDKNLFGLFITESFFCNQIDLLPFEYTDYMSLVYLHEKNIFLGDSQFKIIYNDNTNISIRICQYTWTDNSYVLSATSQILCSRALSVIAVVATYLNS